MLPYGNILPTLGQSHELRSTLCPEIVKLNAASGKVTCEGVGNGPLAALIGDLEHALT